MSKYTDYFKDPRWQKKRLEVMERDDFTCRSCGDKENTLNVHHTYYIKGHKPWEYPLKSLITRCEDCHEKRHKYKIVMDKSIGLLSQKAFLALYVLLAMVDTEEYLDALSVAFEPSYYVSAKRVKESLHLLGESYHEALVDNGIVDE